MESSSTWCRTRKGKEQRELHSVRGIKGKEISFKIYWKSNEKKKRVSIRVLR